MAREIRDWMGARPVHFAGRASLSLLMQIEVVRSVRRRKTVQAQLVDGVLRIAIPDHLSPAEEAKWVEKMRARFTGETDPQSIDLAARSSKLARRYELPEPAEIKWSSRQRTIWRQQSAMGCIAPATSATRR